MNISRITRTHAEARATYDRLSRWYDLLAAASERKYVRIGLNLLAPQPGERTLEIGCGSGYAALKLARTAGDAVLVLALDLSTGMLARASARLARQAGVSSRPHLVCGDGLWLPLRSASLEAIFLSFTLELFDTPEMPCLLGECRRVLRTGGRLAVVALARQEPPGPAIRLYEFAHARFPRLVDCRPIYPSQSLMDSGFQVREVVRRAMWGLPVEIVLACA
jgi:demethylmenaquinone methyltransferase/2-methoxy-6-polyprenyl-1,4-benzoquinol methylase